MAFSRPWFPLRSLSWAADLAARREARFGEPVFLGKVVVFLQGVVVIGVQFCKEKVLDEADMVGEGFNRQGRERRKRGQGGWKRGCGAVGLLVSLRIGLGVGEEGLLGVLGLVGDMHTVLEEVQWHAEGC